jgi:rubrerythrin
MDDEQAKTIGALQFAIQMEIDGKAYYQKAGKASGTRVGKELFQWLAGEEDKHRQKFEEIFGAIKRNQAWPEVAIKPGGVDKLNSIFSNAKGSGVPKAKRQSAELKAIAKAMEMENNTEHFYKEQGEKAKFPAERKFYESLAGEERGHYLALVDYREYLVDPSGWFRKAEHHSLDGG